MLAFISCESNSNSVKVGTFELYESNKFIGTIYRLNQYQIEDYNDGSSLFAKLIWKTDSTFILKGIESNPKSIDSITFLNTIREIGQNKYSLSATTFNVKSDYEYKALLIKKSSKIDKKIYLDTLVKLNKDHR